MKTLNKKWLEISNTIVEFKGVELYQEYLINLKNKIDGIFSEDFLDIILSKPNHLSIEASLASYYLIFILEFQTTLDVDLKNKLIVTKEANLFVEMLANLLDEYLTLRIKELKKKNSSLVTLNQPFSFKMYYSLVLSLEILHTNN